MASVFYSKEPIVLTNKVGSDEPPKEVGIVNNVTFESEEPSETSFHPNDMPSISFEVPIQGVNMQLFRKEKLPRKVKKKFKKLARQYAISQCADFWGVSMKFILTTKYRNMRIKVSNKDLRRYSEDL